MRVRLDRIYKTNLELEDLALVNHIQKVIFDILTKALTITKVLVCVFDNVTNLLLKLVLIGDHFTLQMARSHFIIPAWVGWTPSSKGMESASVST